MVKCQCNLHWHINRIDTHLITLAHYIIGLCSDHAGYELKEFVKSRLEAEGLTYKDFGTYSIESCDYADFAHPLARAVEVGECYRGIALCGSGNGINITLNKHQGIRAALCWIEEIARLARQHNDANILVMPARFISTDEANKVISAFLSAKFEGGRHQQRIDKIPVLNVK
ncbi:ribose-5-phosphate isomerase B [termite gut metagenome]|uniref:Ribose-5-phosphate isomerase B n=1 Tax=termite gut metagenome TaxID=433724 RepID=A0A5J4SXV1_9ZZZZ